MTLTPEQQRRGSVERPPLPADATPIGRDWVEYANSLRGQLEQAQAREQMLRVTVEDSLAELDELVGSVPVYRDYPGLGRHVERIRGWLRKALVAQSEGSES